MFVTLLELSLNASHQCAVPTHSPRVAQSLRARDQDKHSNMLCSC